MVGVLGRFEKLETVVFFTLSLELAMVMLLPCLVLEHS